jgi:regulatory helix-turn-helix LysR family protein
MGSIMVIDNVNLSRIDLNLLVHFDALLTERSVTRAATRIGIGQSAMSHNLARLWDLFADELLTRGPEGMRLTPRALALVEPVRAMLAQVEAIVSREQAFDPATAVRTFRFGLPDSMEILIMPDLLERLREISPQASTSEFAMSTRPGCSMSLMPTRWISQSAMGCFIRDKSIISGESCSPRPFCACSMRRRQASRPRSR